MAVKSFAAYPKPLAKFAQSSLAPAGSALSAKPFAAYPDPLSKFAISSVQIPTINIGTLKPFKPLPLFSGGGVGGEAGYPI